jgi:predicted enzyme related to lactoylglutathione lyase
MTRHIALIVFPVKDLARAKAVYTELLGAPPYVDMPYYVGYRVGDQEIGLDPSGGASGHTHPTPYTDVDDLAASIEALVAAGATLRQEPKDVGGGMRIARLADADGNLFGLRQGKPA